MSTIQTLHSDPTKRNKKILLDKYTFIKKHLIAILNNATPTHSQLMEELYKRTKDNFDGGVQWYGETVKLDLEARNIIVRSNTKPPRYKLVPIMNSKRS
jgi:hypothetical protein